MKWAFFWSGLVLMLAGTQVTYNGVNEGFDATGIAMPVCLVGAGLIASAVGLHIYDNWEEKQ